MPLKIKHIRSRFQAALYVACSVYALSGTAIALEPEPPMTPMRAGGMDRQYFQHTASHTPAPLVIVLHGDGSRVRFARKLGFEELSDTYDFTVVYPKGIKGQWNDGRRTDFVRANEDVNDIAFLSGIIDRLVEDKIADPQRIYITGFSDGGTMAYRAACEMSGRIAAIATVAASMPAGYNYICRPERAVPVMAINSPADSVVPWGGGPFQVGDSSHDNGEVIPVETSIAFWHRRNHCSKQRVQGTDINPFNKRLQVKPYLWRNCPVELYSILGGGHIWPGRAAAMGYNRPIFAIEDNQLDATSMIWNFFKDKKRLPQATAAVKY